ncbi:uncharacterized protein LOC129313287 [Prosopis cineraria]|uniref:uncharacterized protein LOC129313287 n=1 Tax=Prosopis cineraria TaxID=364024 RepID=UPI0024109250|nr:uncharacterized protein LOC129313287 [Prosopis cineraria]
MDFDPDEFPCHASPDNEVVELNYFAQELDFMPFPDFLDDPQLRDMRAEALTIIVQCTMDRNYDVYAPYLAMNYYDRYISRNPMPSGRRNNFYTAICCLVIAFKMRDDDFCVTDFKEAEGLERIVSRATLEKVEREILNGINWRLCCITPFSFLQYYYPRYKELGGFKLSSVTNIIFQAQTDNNLVRFRHSEIAASSLMAATAMVYTKEFLKDFVNDVGWSPCVCVCELIQMISAKNIIVERAEPRRLNNDEASTSRNNGNDDSPEAAPDDEQAIIPKRHGKEVASSSSQNDHHHDSLTFEDNDRATLIRSRPGQEVASSSSQNDHHHDSLKLEDDNLSTPRRTAKEVASSSSQNDHHDPLTLEEDNQANLRRPGKEVASSSSQNDHYTLGDDNQATPRRPEKEVASSSSQNDQHDSLTLEDGDQATPRRPGKEVASSSTQNDHHHDSLTLEDDDQATSRRPGKDVMAFASEIDNDPLAVTDEPEFIRRAGKEVVTVSQSDSSVAGDDEIIEDTISLLKELGFTSITTDPFLTFRDQPEFQWILDSSVENDEPLVTDQLENPWESSGSMMALPSQGDPSEIPSTSGSMVVFTSQGNSSEVTEDQEIPSTSGSLVVLLPRVILQ